MSLLIETTISEFVRYVNRWNTDALYALGLTFYGECNGSAAWSVGNVLIKCHEVAPNRVLCEFDNFDLRGFDDAAKRAYNKLAELIRAAFPIDDKPIASRAYGLLSRQEKRMSRTFPTVFAENPLDAEAEAEFRAQGRETYPNITDKELSEAWENMRQLVEQQKVQRREKERRANMTAAEAAAKFFTDLGEVPTFIDNSTDNDNDNYWNRSIIRDLLTAALDDSDLTALCFDHFEPIYEDFAGGMSKGGKIQRLLDYCYRHDKVEELLRLVKKHNPAQYARFEDQLKKTDP